MATKQWYLKFNVDAWLSEEGLRVCCLEAQGLWFRCLCLMFKNEERRGYLEHKGVPIDHEWLARSVNVPVQKVEKLVAELEKARVFSRDSSGVIYSRRMVRDEAARLQSQEHGKRGGNPNIVKGGVKGLVKGSDNPTVTIAINSNSEPSFKGVQGETSLAGDPPNWLVIEAEFIQQWNRLDGVARCSTNALPNSVVNEFQSAWLTPGWWDRAEQAMRKFPLQNGSKMGLRKFLEPGVIDDIVGGVYDWTRGNNRSNTTQRNPSLRHPDDAEQDWLVADDA